MSFISCVLLILWQYTQPYRKDKNYQNVGEHLQ